MPPTRRQRTNRRNAQKSTGPRSAEGKATASLNALRHGLSAAIGPGVKTTEEIKTLAHSFLDGAAADDTTLSLAREAAAAQIQMQQILRLKQSAWESHAEDFRIRDRGNFWHAANQLGAKGFKAATGFPINGLKRLMPHAFEEPFDSETDRRLAFDLASINRLNKLVRYERQFANRRDRVLRSLSEYIASRQSVARGRASNLQANIGK